MSGPPTCDGEAADSVAEVVLCQVLPRVMVWLQTRLPKWLCVKSSHV